MPGSGRKILITGPPGCGKTTLIKELYSRFPNFCGFWTEEVRERGVRTGFQIVTTWGERFPLSSVYSSSPFRVGKYGVEVENVDLITQKLWGLLGEGKRSFLIDEIGKMEYFSREFRELIRELFHDRETKLIATIAEKDFHPEIRALKEKGQVYHLDRKNFHQILEELSRFWWASN
ncbi:MAG: nucleoside-triphosphatase [bacterium]